MNKAVRIMIVCVLVVVALLLAVMPVAANPGTIEVSLATQLTSSAYHDRNPSFLKAADGTWWVFFARGRISPAPSNPDNDKYDICYVKSTDSGATWSEGCLPSIPAGSDGSHGAFTPAALQDSSGKIWVFYAANGVGIFYFDSTDNGANWNGPTAAFTGGSIDNHMDALVASDGKIWVFYNDYSDSGIHARYYDGVSWSSSVLVGDPLTYTATPRALEEAAGTFRVAYIAGDPLGIYLATSTDNGVTWSSSLVVNTDDDDYDPVLVKDGAIWRLFFAPYIPAQDHQWLMTISSSDLSSWSGPVHVTAGGYGSTKWWDFYPEAATPSSLVLFYASMKNGTARGDCNIWMYKPVDWDLSHDHFEAIQPAIDFASAGDTVNIADGTYDETLNIDTRSDLNVVGADKTTTVIKPSTTLDWNVGGYGSSRKVAVRVVTSTDIDFSNLTFDFDLVKGNNVYGVLYWDSTGVINNNILKNMSAPDASGYYYEITSYARAPSYTDGNRAAVAFTGNTFIDTGRLGILAHEYVTVTVSSNTFYKVVDDFGYAMEIGSQSVGTISGNTIYGYDTPAASDGSPSAGIYVENCFTSGSPHVNKYLWVLDNEIYDCQWGLYVGNEWNGYAGDVDIVLVGTGNNIHDNDDGGVIVSDEDKSAGSSVTATFSGNTLSNNGDYGYYLYTQGDGDLTVAVDGDVITGHDTGVYLEDTAGSGSGSSYHIELHDCDIHGNTTYGVNNTYSGTMINATDNYWGDPSGPYDPSGTNEVPPCTSDPASEKNADGLGDAVSDNVDYCPWLGYVPPEVDLQTVIDASCGRTVYLGPHTYKGGITIGCGLTLKGVPGTVITKGSHGITVDSDDVTIDGVTLDGTGGDPGDCGIYVNAGVSRLWVRNSEIRDWPDDGIHFAGGITDLKIVDNYIHDNDGDGVDFAATPGGSVYIYGNAFRVNTGYGINNGGATEVTAEYNEWGDVAGPTGTNGDGVSSNVDYDPWVFAKLWVDAPATVRELGSVTVYAKMDVHHLYGSHFSLTFPKEKLQLTEEPSIGSFKTTTPGAFFHTSSMAQANATGVITFTGQRADPDEEYDATDDVLLTLEFQAQEISGVSQEAVIAFQGDTADAAAKGGVRIFLDGAISDTITILGTTTVSGVVDLQGRDNDAGAQVDPQPGQQHGWDPDPVTTGAWGTYSFSNMTDDTYEFRIEMARYLDASADVVVQGDNLTLRTCKLLGGDANDDDVIDISDATIIGGQFGKSGGNISDPRADINNDGMVDILDLVLMGGNYSKTESPWTPV